MKRRQLSCQKRYEDCDSKDWETDPLFGEFEVRDQSRLAGP